MKKLEFTVYIEKDEDGVYIGTIPAVHACYAEGATQEKMLKNLSEVLELCVRNQNPKDLKNHKFIGIQNLELAYA